MRQIRPALLPVVLAAVVVASTATVAVATTGFAGQENRSGPGQGDRSLLVLRSQANTTNYLDIEPDAVQRNEYGNASLDASGAVGMAVQQLRGEYATRAFDVEYGNGTDEEARADRLAAEISRLDAQIAALERRQRRAIADYNDGELSTEQFLRELVTIDAAANQVGRQFDYLQQNTTISRSSDVYERIENLRSRLVPLRGPVRDRTAAAMTGNSSTVSVYVVTSQSSNVLSVADGQRLVREVHLPGNRETAGEDTFVTEDDPTGTLPAINRASDLYPWTYDNYATGPGLIRFGRTSVYGVTMGHPHGTLDTFLDGTTRDVFREYQTLRLDRLPTQTTSNATSSTVLRVNRTYGTGPMQVTVTDPTTGEPVDATVRVNGYEVGSTGPDGRLWTVTPHRQVRVQVVTDDGTTRLTFFAR